MYDNNNVRARATHTHDTRTWNTRHINYTHLSRPDVAHSIIKLNGNRDGCGLMGWLIFRVEYSVRVCANGASASACVHKGFKKDDHHHQAHRHPRTAYMVYGIYTYTYLRIFIILREHARFAEELFAKNKPTAEYTRARCRVKYDDEGWTAPRTIIIIITLQRDGGAACDCCRNSSRAACRHFLSRSHAGHRL